jgi:putative membrane protein
MSKPTERRTRRLVMARAALALAAVVIAGAAYYPRSRAETPEAAVPTVAATEKDKPRVPYWHVWTDEKGVSHQKRCEMSAFELKSISEGAAPSWIDKQSTPGATVLVVVQPVGWVGEWHENPKPQWIIPLSGRWFVETMDGTRVEMGQPCGAQDSATNTRKPQLGPVDTYFVTQTSLGTPFQTDSGRIAQKRGGTQAIRSYAELMVSSHIAVNDVLEGITKRKAPVPPPTLLKAAYTTILSTLEAEQGPRFDTEYVSGQVAYQKANAALYQYEIENGTDPDLKAFAQQTLPKIQDHLERALKLQRELKVP